MHPIFDVERQIETGQFYKIPQDIRSGSHIRLRPVFEGPNGSGKGRISDTFTGLLCFAQKFVGHSEFKIPITTFIEPPAIEVANSGKTYRDVARGHEGVEGFITSDELKSPYVNTNVFLAGRRTVHELSTFRFPFYGRFSLSRTDVYKSPNQRTLSYDNKTDIFYLDDFLKVGGYGIHDRSSGSTFVYQYLKERESDPYSAQKSKQLIEAAYATGFLAKEHVTFIVLPTAGIDDFDARRSRGGQADVHTSPLALERMWYEELSRVNVLAFTDQTVVLENDFSVGEELEEVSHASMFGLFVILAINQRLDEGTNLILPKGTPIEVNFPLSEFIDLITEVDSEFVWNGKGLRSAISNLEDGKKPTTRDSCGNSQLIEVKKDRFSFILNIEEK